MEVKFLSCFYQTGLEEVGYKSDRNTHALYMTIATQVCLMLFSPCTCFKADSLVQVLVCVPLMIPLLGSITCHSCDMGSVFSGVFSFENHTLACTPGGTPLSQLPLWSLAVKALRQDSFWNDIITTSSGQVATPLLTCTDGNSFSSQIQSSLPRKPLWLSWAWLWCYGLLTTDSSSYPWKYPSIILSEGSVTP